MYVIDYKHTLVFDKDGYNIIRKILSDTELTESEEHLANEMYQTLMDGTPSTNVSSMGGAVYPIQDEQTVLCFGAVEYDIIIKLLHGDHDLSYEENRRADQMNRTLMAMKKVRQARQDGTYKRPVRRVERPQIAARR